MAHQTRWTLSQVTSLFEKPLLELLFEAQQVHRQHFDPAVCRSARYFRLRPGPARKTVNTVRKAPVIKPGWMQKG